jgi:GH18 family chitinase
MAFRTIGYYENWAQYRQAGGKFFPNQINPNLFTHVNFAFGLFGFVSWSVDPTPTRTGPQRLTGDYSVQPVEWNDQTVLYPTLNALKQQNPNLKTLLSIGGWSMNSCDDQPTPGNPHPYGPYTCQLFSQMAANPNGRAQFINSAIAYCQKYGFDGIDIDWEYPGDSTRGGTPDDLNNFLALVQEFRAAAGPDFLLTMAAPAIVPSNIPQQYINNPQSFFAWLATCAQSFSWLNMETYDYHGSFDDPVKVGTGVNAPLLEDSTPNGPFSIKNSVESYLAAGIPGDKIVLGLPAYGRSYTVANPSLLVPHPAPGLPFSGPGPAGPATAEAGTLAYYEIVQQLLANSLTRGWDAGTLTPYAYNAQTGVWVSYDDEQSIGYKVSYLLQKGLGGAMFWAIDDDTFVAASDIPQKKAGRVAHARRKNGRNAATGFSLISTAKAILDNPSTAPPLPTPVPVTTQNWMSAMPHDVYLSELTIPGTHESCARNLNNIANCQDRDLTDQLNAGIRYLDIRCRQINDIFAIHHGPIYVGFNFGDVCNTCISWLQANPTECILMQIKRECVELPTPTCTTDPGNTMTFQQVFDKYMQEFGSFFYRSDYIPVLGDVRGKIVFVRRFDVDTVADESTHGLPPIPWQDNTTFSASYFNSSTGAYYTFWVQDQYSVDSEDIPTKIQEIQDLLDSASNDPSARDFYINVTSAVGAFFTPYDDAMQIHPWLYGYLGQVFANRLGVLMMDFPDDLLIQRIIGLNDALKTQSQSTDRNSALMAAAAG